MTNTGNVTLTDIEVTDTAFSGTGTPPTITCPSGAASLAPGVAVTCTGSYTLRQADVDAGSLVNTAVASGTPPTGPTASSDPSTKTLVIDASPGLTVAKTSSPAGPAALHAGQSVTYSFAVTNAGNVTLTGIDVSETAFSGSGTAPVVTCPVTTLAPAAQTTCTAGYVLTQDDVDAGSVANTATASGTPPTGPSSTSPPSTATLVITEGPDLTVVKSSSPAGPAALAVGSSLAYSFLVTNTGNVALADVTVNEGAFTGSGTLSSVSCPLGASSLAPGDAITCAASYVITQADIDAGSVANTATATGTPTSGSEHTSAPSTTTLVLTAGPALTLVKSASPAGPGSYAVGQTITYSFLATNTGNVTLTGVTPVESAFSGAGTLSSLSCPSGAASLAPGATVTCTATYDLVQSDVDAGSVTNTATVTAAPPTGAAVSSPPSSSSVTISWGAALTVSKTVSPAGPGVFAAGQSLTYSLVVTNIGNVDAHGDRHRGERLLGNGHGAECLVPGLRARTGRPDDVHRRVRVDAGRCGCRIRDEHRDRVGDTADWTGSRVRSIDGDAGDRGGADDNHEHDNDEHDHDHDHDVPVDDCAGDDHHAEHHVGSDHPAAPDIHVGARIDHDRSRAIHDHQHDHPQRPRHHDAPSRDRAGAAGDHDDPSRDDVQHHVNVHIHDHIHDDDARLLDGRPDHPGHRRALRGPLDHDGAAPHRPLRSRFAALDRGPGRRCRRDRPSRVRRRRKHVGGGRSCLPERERARSAQPPIGWRGRDPGSRHRRRGTG